MAKKRFLRDGVLDELIQYVERYMSTVPDKDTSIEYRFHYANSLLVMFKTCKITLERIEETIEIALENDKTGEICSPLAEAAMHVQAGIISLHESLLLNTSQKVEELSVTDLS
jgi:hypothetical protein